jgi:hypothetical protein
MCGQKAAIRRRKQAAKNFMHMSPMDRPHYLKMSVAKSAAKLARKIANERKMQQKSKK